MRHAITDPRQRRISLYCVFLVIGHQVWIPLARAGEGAAVSRTSGVIETHRVDWVRPTKESLSDYIRTHPTGKEQLSRRSDQRRTVKKPTSSKSVRRPSSRTDRTGPIRQAQTKGPLRTPSGARSTRERPAGTVNSRPAIAKSSRRRRGSKRTKGRPSPQKNAEESSAASSAIVITAPMVRSRPWSISSTAPQTQLRSPAPALEIQDSDALSTSSRRPTRDERTRPEPIPWNQVTVPQSGSVQFPTGRPLRKGHPQHVPSYSQEMASEREALVATKDRSASPEIDAQTRQRSGARWKVAVPTKPVGKMPATSVDPSRQAPLTDKKSARTDDRSASRQPQKEKPAESPKRMQAADSSVSSSRRPRQHGPRSQTKQLASDKPSVQRTRMTEIEVPPADDSVVPPKTPRVVRHHVPLIRTRPDVGPLDSRPLSGRRRPGQRGSDRAAVETPRDEFIAALRLIAESLDQEHGAERHRIALEAGLTALHEADDFYVNGDGTSRVGLDVNQIVESHRTLVSKQSTGAPLSRRVALEAYCSYATQQLCIAGGTQPTASRALSALAQLEAASAVKPGSNGRKAMAMHRAALLIDGTNRQAAMELESLRTRYGPLQD